MSFTPHYITNEKDVKVSIILPLNEYEDLLEDLNDLAAIATRRNEPELTPSLDRDTGVSISLVFFKTMYKILNL